MHVNSYFKRSYYRFDLKFHVFYLTCLFREDIQEKQRTLEQLAIPSEEDLEELRKIHSKRQMIVKIVTKHNADLLELLM